MGLWYEAGRAVLEDILNKLLVCYLRPARPDYELIMYL